MTFRHPEILTRPEDKWPTRLALAVLILIAFLFASSPAWSSIGDNEDRRTVSRHETSSVAHAVPRRAARSGRASRPHAPPGRRPAAPIAAKTAYASAIIAHPQGCPSTSFCACGAAVKIFGQSVRSLWPSTAWYKFPRSAPGHMKVAVRSGHVFVIDYMIDPKTAMAWDYNSGGHKSRYHARSIAGYRIVDPLATRVASLGRP